MALRVIDGGGKGREPPEPYDPHDAPSRRHLRMFAIELLRAVARGNDDQCRLQSEFQHLVEHAFKTRTTSGEIFNGVLDEMHKELETRDWGEFGRPIEQIILASLRCAAEKCSPDGASEGRASQRRQELEHAIGEYIKERGPPPPPLSVDARYEAAKARLLRPGPKPRRPKK